MEFMKLKNMLRAFHKNSGLPVCTIYMASYPLKGSKVEVLTANEVREIYFSFLRDALIYREPALKDIVKHNSVEHILNECIDTFPVLAIFFDFLRETHDSMFWISVGIHENGDFNKTKLYSFIYVFRHGFDEEHLLNLADGMLESYINDDY